jgi:parallel beta helix pectate lyase-like protein
MSPTKYGDSAAKSKIERSIAMKMNRVLRASVSAILLTFFLLPGAALAANVTVGCPGGSGGTYPNINAALNAIGQIGPSLITITGTCNENVSLNDARSLTFMAGPGGAKIVQPQDFDTFDIARSQNIILNGLEIVGVPGSVLGGGGSGVAITEASDVRILGCDIHDNDGDGVFANRNSVLILRQTTIHNNNPGDGLGVTDSDADLLGVTIQDNGSACTVLLNCQASGGGAFLNHAFALFRQNNLVQDNADEGIGAVNGSSLIFRGGPTTIRKHNWNGISLKHSSLVMNSPVLIRENGTACPPDTALLVSLSQACGGISAADNSTLDLRAGTITDNAGAGISATQGTTAGLIGATVSNNSGDGVHIQWISIGNFGPGNSITGNGGASVFCSGRSLALGDLSAFSKVRCGDN